MKGSGPFYGSRRPFPHMPEGHTFLRPDNFARLSGFLTLSPFCQDKSAGLTVVLSRSFCYNSISKFSPEGSIFMETANGIFATKLRELEQQYARMQEDLQLYQKADHCLIRREIQRLLNVCKNDEQALQGSVQFSRSPSVAALAGVQKEYLEKTRDILERHLSMEAQQGLENRAEALSLYAEYAIDFAIQSINHSLFAALSAIDLQMTLEERECAT